MSRSNKNQPTLCTWPSARVMNPAISSIGNFRIGINERSELAQVPPFPCWNASATCHFLLQLDDSSRFVAGRKNANI